MSFVLFVQFRLLHGLKGDYICLFYQHNQLFVAWFGHPSLFLGLKISDREKVQTNYHQSRSFGAKLSGWEKISQINLVTTSLL